MTKPTNDNDAKEPVSPDRELSDKELQSITGAFGDKLPEHPPGGGSPIKKDG